jgi:hypothetical protein
MPGTPPWRENHCAARTGVGWPPTSDTKDSAKPDPLAHAELVARAGLFAAAEDVSGLLPDPEPHAARAMMSATM